MRDDSVKLDSGVVTEPDVPVVPAEIDVVVGVIAAQCLAILLPIMVYDPIEHKNLGMTASVDTTEPTNPGVM